MADINGTYSGVLEYFDPKADSGFPNNNTDWFGNGGTNKWLDEMPFWPELDAINKASASTIDAVKVAYVAGQDRTQWLNDRITAINNRVSFIKGRSNQLLTSLAASGSSAYDGLMKGFTTALSAVPVVGTVINYFVGKDNAAKAVEDYKLQRLIQDYTADLNQLATIRATLVKELQAAPTTGTTLTDTGNAPTPTLYYWLAGIAVLFLLFVYLKKRNRRKRWIKKDSYSLRLLP